MNMENKMRFWARSGDNEVFDDICFFGSLQEALEAEVSIARLPYLAVVEFAVSDVCNVLTACKNGNLFSSVYDNMKIIEVGKMPSNKE